MSNPSPIAKCKTGEYLFYRIRDLCLEQINAPRKDTQASYFLMEAIWDYMELPLTKREDNAPMILNNIVLNLEKIQSAASAAPDKSERLIMILKVKDDLERDFPLVKYTRK